MLRIKSRVNDSGFIKSARIKDISFFEDLPFVGLFNHYLRNHVKFELPYQVRGSLPGIIPDGVTLKTSGAKEKIIDYQPGREALFLIRLVLP